MSRRQDPSRKDDVSVCREGRGPAPSRVVPGKDPFHVMRLPVGPRVATQVPTETEDEWGWADRRGTKRRTIGDGWDGEGRRGGREGDRTGRRRTHTESE